MEQLGEHPSSGSDRILQDGGSGSPSNARGVANPKEHRHMHFAKIIR